MCIIRYARKWSEPPKCISFGWYNPSVCRTVRLWNGMVGLPDPYCPQPTLLLSMQWRNAPGQAARPSGFVCNDDVSPLIRHRLGEFVMDPVYFNRMDPYPSERRKRIPLYYVPIHPYDRGRRDCLPWSILYGAYRAFKVCDKISKYLAPRMYYVAFPQAVYPDRTNTSPSH